MMMIARPASSSCACRVRGWVALLVICVGAIGCGPTKQELAAQQAVNHFHMGAYASAREILRPLALKTDENFALNNVRLGSAALIEYKLDEAETAFLRAYEVMNSVGVNKGGRTLGAVLVDEKIKVWRGEPFERAMTNFYLGLIYYMRQDYENARGAFENALFKLRDYGDEDDTLDPEDYREAESSFALGYLMLGKTWIHLGRDELGDANLNRAVALQPELAPLADIERNRRSNVLLVVDYGYGPQYLRTYGGAVAGFAPLPEAAGRIPAPAVYVNGYRADVPGLERPPVDLLALAQERRWQSIDTIRAVKQTIGTGLIAGGVGYGAYRASQDDFRSEDALVAGGLIAAGMLLRGSSQADVRQWEMLPRSTFVIPLDLPPGTHEISIRFPGSGYTSGYEQTWRGLVAPAQGEAAYYMRMRRWDAGEYVWPPSGAEALPVNASAAP